MTISAVDPDFPNRHVLVTEDKHQVIVTNEPDADIVGLILRNDNIGFMEARLYISHGDLSELHEMIGRAIAAAGRAKVRGWDFIEGNTDDATENV